MYTKRYLFIKSDKAYQRQQQRGQERKKKMSCNEQTPPTRLTDYVILLFDLIFIYLVVFVCRFCLLL